MNRSKTKVGNSRTKTKENTSQEGLGRRRYVRVQLNEALEKAKSILGARVVWPQGEQTEVFDISYSGAAVAAPESENLSRDSKVSLKFELAGLPETLLQVRVVWFNDKMVGVDFGDLEIEARLRLDEFLEDRLIGGHLYPISIKHLSKNVDFQYWFHGPKDTNIFIWAKESKKGEGILKALIELEGQSLLFEEGQFQSGGTREEGESSQYSSDMELSTPQFPLKSRKDQEGELFVILEKEAPLVRRSLEILSQQKASFPILNQLFQAMLKVGR